MKRFLFSLITVAVVFASCAQNPADVIRVRVSKIYTEAFDSLLHHSYINDSLYMSAEYNRLNDEAAKLTQDGELGWYDCDHWVQGQDYDHPAFRILSVKVLSKTKSIVIVEVTNMGERVNVMLPMIKENGRWMIDDFIGICGSEKAMMSDYIKMMRSEKL